MLSEKYNTESEVIIYVPTSHVTGHQADMLSIQLLHDRWEQTSSQPHTCLVLLASCLSLVRRANTDNRAVGTGDPPPGSSTARTSPSTRSPARTSRCASPTSSRAASDQSQSSIILADQSQSSIILTDQSQASTSWPWSPTRRALRASLSPWPRPPAPADSRGSTWASTRSQSSSVRSSESRIKVLNEMFQSCWLW